VNAAASASELAPVSGRNSPEPRWYDARHAKIATSSLERLGLRVSVQVRARLRG